MLALAISNDWPEALVTMQLDKAKKAGDDALAFQKGHEKYGQRNPNHVKDEAMFASAEEIPF